MGKIVESEKKIEKRLADTVKSMGGISFKFVPLHVSGLPDRICLFPGGRILFAELKSTGDKPRKIQLFMIAKIKALGFRVEIIDNSQTLMEILKSYE